MLDKTIQFRSIDSTNLEAYRQREQNAGMNVLFVAEEQTAGKGQQGRTWESQAGKGLWMSLFLGRPESLMADLQLLSLFTGLIVQQSISTLTGVDTQLKWPNDIMIGPKKCGGILTEIQWKGSEAQSAIIGMGINLTHTTSEFSAEIQKVSTSLALSGANNLEKDHLMNSIAQEFFARYPLLENASTLVDLWNQHAWKLDEVVDWQQGEEKISGLFRGIDENGSARLQVENELMSFSSGEIRWIY